jgi:formate-dependent nitrite reductase membrane component NrfD
MIQRYGNSVEPACTDGRDIDLDVGQLIGEAAQQISEGAPDKHEEQLAKVWHGLPEPSTDDPTYYDRPMLQESVWSWAIPLYYYVGGLSGASMTLAAAATLRKDEGLDRFIHRAHLIGFVGTVLSGGLLVYDLGRPERFLNMLRVFRPTSPMNVGAWILSATGGTAFLTVAMRREKGWIGLIGEGFGIISGVFGLGLATYTGVLVANTAIPVWQSSRRSLPVLFGASAMASIGCALDTLGTDESAVPITRIFGIIGRAAELIAGHCMEREAGSTARVARPLTHGMSGRLFTTSKLLTAASLALVLLPRPGKRRAMISGLLGTFGSLLLRFGVESAGKASARDPRASFHQQRQRS